MAGVVTLAAATLSLRARVARSIFWITWSRGLLQLLTFATTLVVARILMPADYGVMALATFFTGTAGMLAEMGLGSAIIQFRDLSRREVDTCFWITIMLATIGYLALALGSTVIARWFAVPLLAAVLPVLALVLPLTACRVVSDSLLRRRLALDRISQAEIIGAVVTLPVTLICASAGLGVWTLVISALVSPTVRSIATFAFQPWRPGFLIGGERVREVVQFSLATVGTKVMWHLRESANPMVLGKVTGQDNTVGLYSMAEDLAHLAGNKISTAINMLGSPVMAELQMNVDAMRAAFYQTLRLTAVISLPTSAGIALVAEEMIAVLLGPKWLPAVPVLRSLCVYAAVRSVDVLLPPVLFARRRERFLFWYCCALLIIVPTAAVFGALWDGAVGMVVVYTPVYCITMIVMANKALAELKTGLFELWSALWPILAATAVMATFVSLVEHFVFSGREYSAAVRLAILSVGGAICYGVTLVAIGSPVVKEGAQVITWTLKREPGGS
jgi:O-antigen/teichoic acid export membrane protein